MDSLTARARRAYDRLRRVRQLTNSLRLERATATGYEELSDSPIRDGWYCEYLQDAETGEQFIQVLISEDAWDTAMMREVAAVVIEKKRHKASVWLAPKGAPFVWQLKAAAIGESLPYLETRAGDLLITRNHEHIFAR